jgi:nucleoside-diphosphate-sugar epimerase
LTDPAATRDGRAMTKLALVAGAGGAASKRLIDVLRAEADWSVIALARSPRPPGDRLIPVSVDLLDRDACARALAAHRGITHLFYTARAKHGESGVESVEDNVAMLRNVLDAVEPGPGLAHVHLVQGTKYYGMHLGPFRTPAREDDPRHPPPNFYYDQQDLLAGRQRGQSWTWSASRPTFIYDFAPERARNAVSVIGAYAAIVRELGQPLDFPGSAAAFDALRDMTDATLLARAMTFIATTPTCGNRAFNVVNGDVFRWRTLWPKIAGHFETAVGGVRPIQLSEWIKDKQPVWDRIVQRYGLLESRLHDVADWHFADFHWAHGYDICSSPEKLRRAGFPVALDSEQAFIGYLARYREAKILP